MRAQNHGDAQLRGSCVIRVTSVPDEARPGRRQTAAIGRMRRPSGPRRSSSRESQKQQPCRDMGMGAGFDRDGRKHRPGANFAAGAASGKGAGLAYRVAAAGGTGPSVRTRRALDWYRLYPTGRKSSHSGAAPSHAAHPVGSAIAGIQWPGALNVEGNQADARRSVPDRGRCTAWGRRSPGRCPVDFFTNLFDTSDFPRRRDCGLWTPAQGWLHILSDLGVWSAYLAIPGVIGFFLLRKKEVPFRGIFWLFGAFILACGATHLMEAVIFWWPAYRLAGLLKLLTAVVSWVTVIALVPVVPRALAMRSPGELEREAAGRRRAEERSRETGERFRQLVENIREIFWIQEGGWERLLYISPAYEEAWGRTCQSLYEQPRSWIDSVPAGGSGPDLRPSRAAGARDHHRDGIPGDAAGRLGPLDALPRLPHRAPGPGKPTGPPGSWKTSPTGSGPRRPCASEERFARWPRRPTHAAWTGPVRRTRSGGTKGCTHCSAIAWKWTQPTRPGGSSTFTPRTARRSRHSSSRWSTGRS